MTCNRSILFFFRQFLLDENLVRLSTCISNSSTEDSTASSASFTEWIAFPLFRRIFSLIVESTVSRMKWILRTLRLLVFYPLRGFFDCFKSLFGLLLRKKCPLSDQKVPLNLVNTGTDVQLDRISSRGPLPFSADALQLGKSALQKARFSRVFSTSFHLPIHAVSFGFK